MNFDTYKTIFMNLSDDHLFINGKGKLKDLNDMKSKEKPLLKQTWSGEDHINQLTFSKLLA